MIGTGENQECNWETPFVHRGKTSSPLTRVLLRERVPVVADRLLVPNLTRVKGERGPGPFPTTPDETSEKVQPVV